MLSTSRHNTFVHCYQKVAGRSEAGSSDMESGGGFASDSSSHSNIKVPFKGKGKGAHSGKRDSTDDVVPVPHPLVAPRPPPAEGGFYWGDFLISPMRRFVGAPQDGWGVTCGLHWYNRDGTRCATECKTSTGYTARGVTLSDEECILQCKRWILTGFELADDVGDNRWQHIMCRKLREVGPQVGEDADAGPSTPPGFPPYAYGRRRR